jgi:hypothetical protein
VIDPKYEKYVKMKKMLPEGAVRQKMMQDGLPDGEIEAFFKMDFSGAASSAPAADSAGAPGGPPKLSFGGAAIAATVAARKPPAPPEPEVPPTGMSAKPKLAPNAKLKG